MKNEDLVELTAVSVTYYSHFDEECFFHWLKSMSFVKRYFGEGDVLFILVDKAAMTEADLMDLVGFFYRYGISMGQLRVFDCPQFKNFRRSGTYWHHRVFKAKQG